MKNLLLVFTILSLASCTKPSQEITTADNLKITWAVIENFEGTYTNSWKISNQGPGILPTTGWAIYYNHVVGVPQEGSVSGSLNVNHISGTFYSITPSDAFTPLGTGESTRIDLECGGYGLKVTDAPNGIYIIFDGQEPQLIQNFEIAPFPPPHYMKRGSNDNIAIPTTELRYEQNEYLTYISQHENPGVIPTPYQVNSGEGVYILPKEVVIGFQAGLENEAELLKNKLSTTGHSVVINNNPSEGDIRLSIGVFGQGKSENYRLAITQDHISVTGSDPAGVFYGTQSVVSLWPLEAWEGTGNKLTIPCQIINDRPRFAYRGLYLDVARNFQQPETVKQAIDMMAHYKLNRLTFGVSNDEGWRLEIKGIPELTEIGSRRGHTENELDHLYPAYGSGPYPDAKENHGTGFYSREQFIDLLQYAQKRHVEIIPEINFPGHARAAVKSMEARTKRIKDSGSSEPAYTLHDPNDQSEYSSVQAYNDNVICPCQESVYQFLEAVVSDLVTIYQEAGVKFNTVHTGGDEVPAGIWQKSPLCMDFLEQNPQVDGVSGLSGYFLQRYHQILQQHQLVTAGWEEIAMHRVSQEDENGETYSALVPNPELADLNLLPYIWNSDWGTADDLGYKLANLGYQVVLCNANNFYFDFAYNKDPMEPGFYWSGLVNTRKPFELVPLDLLQTATVDKLGNPIDIEIYEDHEKLTEAGAKNVVGIQGQLFSETVKGPQLLQYYLFPKMLGFVERAWAADPSWSNLSKKSDRLKGLDQHWNQFANSVAQRELPKLDLLWDQVNYRVPLPGAVIDNGKLIANVAFPGLSIRYTLDGSEPDENSSVYEGPVEAKKPVKLKAFSRTGKSSRTSILDY